MSWFASDFLVFGLLLGALVLCATFALWRLFRPGWSRLYWAAGLALMIFGGGAMVTAEPADPDRVPPEFALGWWVLVLGMVGIALPALWMLLSTFGKQGTKI